MTFKSVTLDSDEGRFYEIITDVGVSPIADSLEARGIQGMTYWTRCLWDTGAYCSAISSQVVEVLGLIPEGETRVMFGNGEETVKAYLVDLVLPNLLSIKDLPVTECANNDSFGVIIGMDFISMGDLAITNHEGTATFSFRVPSMERIDFQLR